MAQGQDRPFLTWKEVLTPITKDPISFQELKNLQTQLENQSRLRYRIYRSTRPIESIELA